MKTMKRYILSAMLVATAGTMMAQDLNSAYFTDDFKFRHDMNPAYGNAQSYVSIPALGNLNISTMGNFGLESILYENKWNEDGKNRKTTTFMNPNISSTEALSNFSSGNNELLSNIRLTILSAGFKAFGGYNTIELNSKTNLGISLPYGLFAFAKNIGNETYDIGGLGFSAQSYAELAFGHSRDINEKLRVGAKVKLLFGIARADLNMEGLTADLTGNEWTISGQAKAEVMMKGFKFQSEREEYDSRPGEYYNKVTDIDVDGVGLGGFGLAFDLGGIYKINDDITVSAAINDLGFISWSDYALAQSSGMPFHFKGFNGGFDKNGNPNGLGMNADDHPIDDDLDFYGDQLADFANLEDQGEQGGATKGIGATINLGGEYTLPMYRQVSFGLLSSTRLNGSYTWTEARLSANYRPLKWIDGGINFAVGTYRASFVWNLNIHPKGFNFFVGMDHLLGKTSKEMIPLSSNANVALGMSITW